MNKLLSTFQSVALVSLLVATDASASQLKVNPTMDAMIFDDGSGSGSANASGRGPAFFAGADSTPRKKRSLVKFDLSSIPNTATVSSVQLDLVIGQIAGSMGGGMGCGMMCTPASRTFSIYQVDYTNTWIEGDTGLTACGTAGHPFTIRCASIGGTGQGWLYSGCSGAGTGASCGNDVTWEYYNATGTHLWAGHGSGSPQNQDYGSASFGNPTYGDLNAVGAFTFNNFLNNATMSFTGNTTTDHPGLTAMVQDWVSHSGHNNGLEIRAASLETTTQSFIGWYSLDGAAMNSNNLLSPQLTVNY